MTYVVANRIKKIYNIYKQTKKTKNNENLFYINIPMKGCSFISLGYSTFSSTIK